MESGLGQGPFLRRLWTLPVSVHVGVVNEKFVQHYLKDKNPIGQGADGGADCSRRNETGPVRSRGRLLACITT